MTQEEFFQNELAFVEDQLRQLDLSDAAPPETGDRDAQMSQIRAARARHKQRRR